MSYEISRIIEASYKNAISTNENYNSFEVNIPPLHLPVGSRIQIDGSIVEEKSASTDVIELSNYNYSKTYPYVSSKQTIEFLYYLNHNGINNLPLPWSGKNGYKVDDATNKNESTVYQKTGSLIQAVDWLDDLTALDAWIAEPTPPQGQGATYPYGGGGGFLDYNNINELGRAFFEMNNEFDISSLTNTIADPPSADEVEYRDYLYSIANMTNLIPRNKYDSTKFVRVNPTYTSPSGITPLTRYTTQTQINLSDDLLETPEELSFKINSILQTTDVMSPNDTILVEAPRSGFSEEKVPLFNMSGNTIKNIPANIQTPFYNSTTGEYYHKYYSNCFVDDIDKAEGGIGFMRCSTVDCGGVETPLVGVIPAFSEIFRRSDDGKINVERGAFALDFTWSAGWQNAGFFAPNNEKPNINDKTQVEGQYFKKTGIYNPENSPVNGLDWVYLDYAEEYHGIIIQITPENKNWKEIRIAGSTDGVQPFVELQTLDLTDYKYQHALSIPNNFIIEPNGLTANAGAGTTYQSVIITIMSLIPDPDADENELADVYAYNTGFLTKNIEESSINQALFYPCLMGISNCMSDMNSQIYNFHLNLNYDIINYGGPNIEADYYLNGHSPGAHGALYIKYPNIAFGNWKGETEAWILYQIREMPELNRGEKQLALCILFADKSINPDGDGKNYITPLSEPFIWIPLTDSLVRNSVNEIPAFLITDITTWEYPVITGLGVENFTEWNKSFIFEAVVPLTFCELTVGAITTATNMANSVYNGLPYEAMLGTTGGGQFCDIEGSGDDRDKHVNEFLAIPDKMILPYNIHFDELNFQRIADFFRKTEIYIGNKTTYKEQQEDSLNWICELDVGIANGRLCNIMRNIEPTDYQASADVNNGSWYPCYYPNMISKEQRVNQDFDLSRMWQVYPKNRYSNNGHDIQTDKNYIRVYTRYNKKIYDQCKISNFELRNNYPPNDAQSTITVPDNANPRYNLAQFNAYGTDTGVDYAVAMNAIDVNNWTATFTIPATSQRIFNLTNTTFSGQTITGTYEYPSNINAVSPGQNGVPYVNMSFYRFAGTGFADTSTGQINGAGDGAIYVGNAPVSYSTYFILNVMMITGASVPSTSSPQAQYIKIYTFRGTTAGALANWTTIQDVGTLAGMSYTNPGGGGYGDMTSLGTSLTNMSSGTTPQNTVNGGYIELNPGTFTNNKGVIWEFTVGSETGTYVVDNTNVAGATITLTSSLGSVLTWYCGVVGARAHYTNLNTTTLPTSGGGTSLTPVLGLSTIARYFVDDITEEIGKKYNIPIGRWEWTELNDSYNLTTEFSTMTANQVSLFNYQDTFRGNGGIPTSTPERPFPKPLDNLNFDNNISPETTNYRTCFRICSGEWAGYDPDPATNRMIVPMNIQQSVNKNQNIKVLESTQAQVPNLIYGDTTYSQDIESYINMIYIGAKEPLINFELSRFNFKQFHTPNVFNVSNGNLEQAGQTISYFNFDKPIFKSFYGFDQYLPDKANIININTSIFDSISGIGINNLYVQNEKNDDLIKCYYNESGTFNYRFSLLDLLGFKLPQLLPYYGKQNKRFSNSKYNSIDINNRYEYSSFFTTNGEISQANVQGLSLFAVNQPNTPPTPPATTPPVLRGLPSYSLGYLGSQPFALQTQSATLRAEDLSAKLQFPFYLIETNLPSNGYYTNNNMLNINAYCFRQYKASNMWFSYASTYATTLTQEMMLSNVRIRIYNSNNRLAENIGANSSVFIKVSHPAQLPQLLEPPNPEDQLLEDIDHKLSHITNSQTLVETGGGEQRTRIINKVKQANRAIRLQVKDTPREQIYRPRMRRTKSELARGETKTGEVPLKYRNILSERRPPDIDTNVKKKGYVKVGAKAPRAVRGAKKGGKKKRLERLEARLAPESTKQRKPEKPSFRLLLPGESETLGMKAGASPTRGRGPEFRVRFRAGEGPVASRLKSVEPTPTATPEVRALYRILEQRKKEEAKPKKPDKKPE